MGIRHIGPLAALIVACGGAALPPAELTSARTAYGQAANGPASQYAPEQLLTARRALDSAEKSFKAAGDSDSTRTLAYVAQRKAEIARSAGRLGVEQHDIEQSANALKSVETELLASGARLPRDTSEALAFTANELQRERVACADRDQRNENTVDDLRHVVHIRRTPNGFTVALPAPENFQGDEGTTIGDDLATRLDSIAVAIERGAPGANVTIESHADTANWGDAHDKYVAQKRADVIAAYLATHGVPRERIRAVGLAPRHYDRSSAEYFSHGLERRIDIIVTR